MNCPARVLTVAGVCAGLLANSQVQLDQPLILSGSDGSRSVRQLEAPVNGTDAVNKDYVDAAVAGTGGASMPTHLSNESTGTMSFGAAMRYCRDLSESGFTDWRMPTMNELVHVYSRGENPVTSDTSPNYIWAFALQGHNLWDYIHVIRLSDGYITVVQSNNSTSYRARCVR